MPRLVVRSFDIVWALPEDWRWNNEQLPPATDLGKTFQKVLQEYYSDEGSQRIGLSETENSNQKNLLVRYRFHTNVLLHFNHFEGTYSVDDVLVKSAESLEEAMGVLRELTKDEEKLSAIKKEAYPCLFLKDFSDGIEKDGLRGTVSRNKIEIAHLLLQETSDWDLELPVVEEYGILDNLSFYQHAILMISDQSLVQLQVEDSTKNPDLYRNTMLFTVCNVANEISHLRMLKSLYGKLRRALSREDASKTLAKIKSDALVQLYEYSRTEEGIYSGAKSVRKRIRALWDVKELQDEVIQALNQLSSVIQERELAISNMVLSVLTIAAAVGSLVAVYQYLSGGLLDAVQVVISTIVLVALVWLILPPFLRRRAVRD